MAVVLDHRHVGLAGDKPTMFDHTEWQRKRRRENPETADSITGGTRMTLAGEKGAERRRDGGTVSIRKSAMPTLMIGINA